MEHFYTIQGEGFHQGKAAYFIRLGGCDVGCVWCDVKDSWDVTKHPLLDIKKLAADVFKSPAELVVITGGEPLMHDLTYLTNALHSVNKQVHIETSGAYPLSGNIDWITLSPKKFKAPLPEIIPMAHELKVVIFNKADFKWAEEYALKVSRTCKLFLQPEWSKRETMMPLISDYILKHPKWEVSLQIHKYMQLP
jgi:organic radical activating enzyme